MGHILTDLLRIQLRAVKPIMRPGKLNASRTLQDKLGELMHKAHSAKTDMLRQDFDRFEACWVLPKKEAKRGVILYLHGGGYVAGDLPYALGFGSVLADDLQRRVFCAAYRLAPEHPFPAALEDALTAYQYLLAEGLSGRDIVLCGESAGGGLIWALSLKLKELGLELPAGIIGISPWVDLSLSGPSYQENEKLDPCLTLELLEYYAEVYAGGPSREPLVSPLFGDLAGMPPALLFAGSDELLLDDAVALHQKLLAVGGKSELYIAEKMWHAYVLYGVHEAHVALQKISVFIEDILLK